MTHEEGQRKREVHHTEPQQAQNCTRGQMQGLGHASDAAASSSPRREHEER